METFAQDTYWLFGSEACSICRSHEQSNIDGKIDHVGVDEVANQIIHDSNIFAIHMSKPTQRKSMLWIYSMPMMVGRITNE